MSDIPSILVKNLIDALSHGEEPSHSSVLHEAIRGGLDIIESLPIEERQRLAADAIVQDDLHRKINPASPP